jgi:hypothetical protein
MLKSTIDRSFSRINQSETFHFSGERRIEHSSISPFHRFYMPQDLTTKMENENEVK